MINARKAIGVQELGLHQRSQIQNLLLLEANGVLGPCGPVLATGVLVAGAATWARLHIFNRVNDLGRHQRVGLAEPVRGLNGIELHSRVNLLEVGHLIRLLVNRMKLGRHFYN